MRRKTGGRQKGTPNKDSAPVQQKADELNVDPFTILLHFASGNWKALGYQEEHYILETASGNTKIQYVISPEMRMKAAAEACQYLLPKKKALEVSSDPEKGFRIVIEDYTKK